MNQRSHDRRNVSNRALRAVVAEIGPEDGVDPRYEARARTRARPHRGSLGSRPAERAPGRKALQLGRQVAQTLNNLLAGEARDEHLQGLRVLSVAPAPDTSRLLVTLVVEPASSPSPGPTIAARLARLNQASGWLRAEVAQATCRKRVPFLAFRLAPDDRPESTA